MATTKTTSITDTHFSSIQHERNPLWHNWARTARCQPDYFVNARSLEDLATIVNFARENGKHIRAVSTGHSWSALVPTDEILVDVRALNRVSLDLYDPAVPKVSVECGATVKDVNVVLEASGYTLPFNVVLESVRWGGLVATGSHGSGWNNQTLSDLVWSIDIVAADGSLRHYETGVDSEEVMNAARLNLGMFGLIYKMTLRIQPTWRVHALDRRVPIPEVMANFPEWVTALDNMDMFWWPFTKQFWIKQWHRTEAPITARPRYNMVETVRSKSEIYLFYKPTLELIRHVPRMTPKFIPATFLFSPSQRDQVVEVVEAIHYRRGLEIAKMGCVEIAFKVAPDFSNVREAIQLTMDLTESYAARGKYPINVVLNVRFVKNSDCWLSPAFGEGHTCYIEVLSHAYEPNWFQFSGELASKWLQQPRAMVHWAKEFRHIPGVVDHIKRERRAEIDRFNQIKTRLGVDPDNLFVNGPLREIFE